LSALLVDELTEALRRTPAAVVVATHDRMMLADCASWPSVDLTGSRVSGRWVCRSSPCPLGCGAAHRENTSEPASVGVPRSGFSGSAGNCSC